MYELNLKAADAIKDLGSKGTAPTLPTANKHSISRPEPPVKHSFSFSSPKSDTDTSTFDTDIPMRHIDGSVRTYAEYKAEQEAAAEQLDNEHESTYNESRSRYGPTGTDIVYVKTYSALRSNKEHSHAL